ncbi:MAG: restriction endonuclease subunit S [Desulfobacterales bacterium]|nr:restriction endonuclease subunit S [Desulfobacterales bacterium]
MELKKGCKQTEVGVIPEDWDATRLRNIGDIKRGASPRPIDSPVWFDEQSQIGWLRISDVTKSSKYLKDTTQNLSALGVKHSRYVERNNLVMSICATVGRPILTRKNVCIHDGFVVFSNLKIDKEYLYYILSSIEKDWSKHGQTGSQMNLNTGLINSTVIPLPPTKAEQTAIAAALSDADALIQSMEKLIAKKRLIKHGAMQELHQPKEGWVVKKLGEIAFFTNGKAHEQFIDDAGDYIVVNSKFISTEGEVFKNASISLCPLNIGDITMVMSDIPNGKALAKCFIIPKSGKYTLNQRICALRTETLDTIFLAFVINRNKYFLAFDSGTGQTNLKKQDVLECPIDLPPTKKEQIAIAKVLSDMDAEISTLETKLAKYKRIKQGMMQELLTGKIRLV